MNTSGMKAAIENFAKQFEYEPVIKNQQNFKKAKSFIVAGMGGSHLAAGLLLAWKPGLNLIIHRDYDLPEIPDDKLAASLFVASSYSGNTEEVVDSLNQALGRGLRSVTISVGGKLAEIAQKHGLPHILLPDTGIQPRSALGFSFRALLKVMGEQQALAQTKKLASSLKPAAYEKQGKKLAQTLSGFVPVIYSSTRNLPLAYNWKIKFNETGKIPAFYNVFPELNHNEMTGFDVKEGSRALSANFRFIFLSDAADHPQIKKRMQVLKILYEARGLGVEILPLEGEDTFLKMFSSLVLGDWTAYYTALHYGLEPELVPMVEEFKKLVK